MGFVGYYHSGGVILACLLGQLLPLVVGRQAVSLKAVGML